MPKLDSRQIKRIQAKQRRRARFNRAADGSGLFLPGTTGGRVYKAVGGGRSMPRIAMLRSQQLRGGGFFSSLKSVGKDLGKKAVQKGMTSVMSTVDAQKKLVENKARQSASQLANDVSKMALSAIGAGGPVQFSKMPPNQKQRTFMKNFAKEYPHKAMPALGGQIDQDRLRNLIMTSTSLPKQKRKAKKKPVRGRGLVYL